MAHNAKVPIGLQLFSVRGECEKDLPATLKAVAESGFDVSRRSLEALRRMGK